MKELRFFYTPEPGAGILPPDETQHAIRVLRLRVGDEVHLIDGCGSFHRALITEATNHRCAYEIVASEPQEPEWEGAICIAVAPTKNNDRMEWFAEKATEIGIDAISLLNCTNSERRVVNTERIRKILVAAMKQSHKARLPRLDEMTDFKKFIRRTDLPGQRFIAHCHDPREINPDMEYDAGPKMPRLPFLGDILQPRRDAIVLIGPEGDFTQDEVRHAEAAGFTSVSLGTSRLRTETAALVATHLVRLANRND